MFTEIVEYLKSLPVQQREIGPNTFEGVIEVPVVMRDEICMNICAAIPEVVAHDIQQPVAFVEWAFKSGWVMQAVEETVMWWNTNHLPDLIGSPLDTEQLYQFYKSQTKK